MGFTIDTFKGGIHIPEGKELAKRSANHEISTKVI